MPTTPSRETILIVDDDIGSRIVLKLFLERHAFRTLIAADGEEGILLAKAARPQVILLDIVMPKLDGYQVLQRLKSDSDTQGIPVIMLTARDAEKNIRASFKLGAVFHIEKPFDAEDLLRKIQAALVQGRSA